ncbi:ANTAR domain-containing protein [Pseudonocardia sp. RS11V-5]|uniref:ANTAR domain-containing protein n=1 Tax=Pseudonocardia terrae TaxID=2905831 RepID=UPI001E573AAA|nr:ANTAR domain-containing protein [Pseudonocardia terrae]MCE3556487.1 ANTAR domain-containing protein [Pseudonocardia terrae]
MITPEQRTAEPAGQVELRAQIAELEQTVRQLRGAMRSRKLIDQAMGVLMALEHRDQDRAFGRFRALSERQKCKLNQVGAGMIRHVVGAAPSDDRQLHIRRSARPVDGERRGAACADLGVRAR